MQKSNPRYNQQMDIGRMLETQLSPQAHALVRHVGQVATEPVYLVGGAVRDVLLGRSSNDLDFVTEGAGIPLAEAIQAKLGGELTGHERFGTAVWTPPAELFPFTIDFITARRETYSHPAALPDVAASNMRDDLQRRDFTINAIAVRLDGDDFGQLLDPHGGQTDLKKQQIRILHQASFEDDPTRIFRAVRYAGRLDFALADGTAQAARDSAEAINLLSADRLRHEFEKIFGEEKPISILKKLDALNVFPGFKPSVERAFGRLDTCLHTPLGQAALADLGRMWLRFLAWVCAGSDSSKSALALADRFNFPADRRQDVEKIGRFYTLSHTWDGDVRPGTVEKLFRKMSAAQLTVLQAADILPPALADTISPYYSEWRHVKTHTDGNTLKQLGLPPGPRYKIILDALLEAKLNGVIKTEREEADLRQKLVQTS